MHNDSEFYNSVNTKLKETLNHPVPEVLIKEIKELIKKLEIATGQYNPKKDKIYGRQAENIALNFLLLKNRLNKIIEAYNDDYRYDHKIGYKNSINTYEVKVDLQTKITTNIAFELRCKKQDSGIYITESDYVIYIIPGKKYDILIFDRKKLLKYLKEAEEKKTHHIAKNCGDKDRPTDCMLIPYVDIVDNWKLGEILLRKEKL